MPYGFSKLGEAASGVEFRDASGEEGVVPE
jgi:hypothetical protein